MSKIKNIILTDKQKKLALYIGIGLVILIVIVLTIVISNSNKKELSEKERLTNYLEKQAKDFYQNEYYQQVSELTDDMSVFLANFEKEGINMSINVLIENDAISDEEAKQNMKNKDTNTKCDYDNTKAVIYPKSPYKKNSYDIRIQLDCGL